MIMITGLLTRSRSVMTSGHSIRNRLVVINRLLVNKNPMISS